MPQLLDDPSYAAGARNLGAAIRAEVENSTMVPELEDLAGRRTTPGNVQPG